MSDFFKKPPPHVPDGVIGDTIDEVPHPDLGTDYKVPYEHTSDFQPPPPHVPDGVIGDTIDEVWTPFQTPTPHVPELVVGDTLDEVPQPPPLSTPNPPLEPQLFQTPGPHVPDNVVGDTIDEVPQPPPLSVPDPSLDPVAFQPEAMPPPVDPQPFQSPEPYDPIDQVEQPDIRIEEHTPNPFISEVNPGTHIPEEARDILRRLAEVDSRLASQVSAMGGEQWAPYASVVGGPGSRVADPFLHAKIFKNYVQQVGPTGIATFTALQVALHALNSKYGRIFNPFYLNVPLPPSLLKTTMDAGPKVHEEFANTIGEQAAKLEAVRRPGTGGVMEPTYTHNSYGPDNPYEDGSVFSHKGFVDLTIGNTADQGTAQAAAVSTAVPYGNGLRRRQVDHSKIFDSSGKILPEYAAGSSARRVSREDDALAAANFNWRGSRGVIPAAFDIEDEQYGYVSRPLPDDVTYVPLMLQDLRPIRSPLPNTDGTRRVYFRALNLQTSENFTPNWSEDEAFGRVDPVMGYRNTGRQISVSFYCYAFAPEDIDVIYRKRSWLMSMVYPEVARDLSLQTGPVVRLRVGDLYNNSRGGLPGVLKDLSFDDSDQVWELKKGHKVPRGFTVSFTMQVLHEGTPGINDGQFTTVRASVPERRPDDQSRFNDIRTETDDRLATHFNPPRRSH